uniref:Serine/threonine/tyrosine kinase family protein n=1 Tax=Rhizophora mucronata TaxID=61149 RepID=A0A2P2PJY7_RHIMU
MQMTGLHASSRGRNIHQCSHPARTRKPPPSALLQLTPKPKAANL